MIEDVCKSIDDLSAMTISYYKQARVNLENETNRPDSEPRTVFPSTQAVARDNSNMYIERIQKGIDKTLWIAYFYYNDMSTSCCCKIQPETMKVLFMCV